MEYIGFDVIWASLYEFVHRIQGDSYSQLTHLITFAQLVFYKALVSVSTRNEVQSRLQLVHPFSLYGMPLRKDRHNFIVCKIFWHLGPHMKAICTDVPFLLPVVHFDAFVGLEVRDDWGSLGEPFRCFENLWDKAHRGRGNWWLGWFYFITEEVVPNASLSNKEGNNRHNSYHCGEKEDVYGYLGNLQWQA